MNPGLRRLAALALLCLFSLAGQADEVYRFPTYRNAAQVDADCRRLLADLARQREALARMPAEPAREVLTAFDALTRRVDDTLGPMWVLSGVHPDKPVRDAFEACSLAYETFNGEFSQDARLYALLGKTKAQDAIDRGFRRDLLELFEDAGAALPAATQAKARALNLEIARLVQDFDRRTREDTTRLAFSVAALKGVPKALWHKAPRDARQRIVLGVDGSTSATVLQTADRAATRERMWRAVNRIGGEANLKTLAQLVALRQDYARLFGVDTYAALVLRRRMVSSEAAVQAFLSSVNDAVRQLEASELVTLRAAKAEHLHTPVAATPLQRWDVAFYTERVRRARFKLEQAQFHVDFPPDAALKFVFAIAQRLFGLSFTPLAQELWHPDARAFAVRQADTQTLLGTLFVDLFPREGKEGSGAYVSAVRNASTLVGSRPVAVLVTNLDRKGLSTEDLSATLLHEFGHALHVLLSQTRYSAQGGTNVKLDFSEAPSQMLEDWVYHPSVLELFAQTCPACKPVSADLLARADQARRFGRGIDFARQHLYASYDMALYGRSGEAAPVDPLALWAAMEGATPLGYVAGSRLPASFGHLASGYVAGYYSYLWSLALAVDLRTAFGDDRLSAAIGARYRRTILENGGQVAPAELMQQFLGRPGDTRAFFKSLEAPEPPTKPTP